jgi:hypothetical protein
MRAPGFQLHQRFSASSSKPARRFGKCGNKGFAVWLLFISTILPGFGGTIAGFDVDQR